MKKIIFLILSFCMFLNAAESIEWYNSYEIAKTKSQKSHKKILLLVVSPTCPYCVKLLNEPMSSPNIIKIVKKDYEPLMLMNVEQLPEGISVKGVPAMFKIAPNDKVVGQPLIGLLDAKTIKVWLTK